MARQNSILPKGAFPHLRQPHAEPEQHETTTHHHGVHGGYPQSYEPPRDIFSSLRPDQGPAHGAAHGQPHGAGHGQPQGLTSRLEAFASPTGSRFDPPRQDAYGNAGYGDPAGQAYPAHGGQAHGGYGQGYDAYGRPQPAAGGYATQHAGYPADNAAAHYAGHHVDPQQDPRYAQAGHGYAGAYGRDDGYAYDDPYRPDAAQAYGAQPGAPQGEYYPEEYAEEAEPETRRGPRAIVVVGALVAAIGLGGGLAYGYKSLTSGGSGKLPILRADSAPTKAQPTEAGGKQVPHTDKKFLNRLTDERGQARPVPVSILPPAGPEREAASGDGSTRRVPTMVVNRDGSIAPTGSTQTAPPPIAGVPGMVIEGLPPRAPQPQLREAQQPVAAPPRAVAEDVRPAPPAPRRVASAQPAVAVEPPAAAAPAPAPERADTERRRPVVRQAARTVESPSPAAAPATTSTGTSGYVAVLSSRKSHMDALKTFADMQQKYSSVLQGRTPDVRETNLGDKGVWFRVVVGPPGSRESANGVCNQLKTAGYVGCWVMTY